MGQSLVFIHGFLGQPTDWQVVVKNLELEAPEIIQSVHFIDLNRDFILSELNFQAWPEAFLRWSIKHSIASPICLVGYSMGGRLILPLLEKGVASKAVFLSSQFGFQADNLQDRAERRVLNQRWAQRFLTDPWDEVNRDWNAQEIFKGTTEVSRLEKNFDRQKLAAFLTAFSISEQKDYSDLWLKKDLKLLYLVGENDSKYRAFAEQIQALAINTEVRILKSSGHRLLLDQPQLVAQEISDFLRQSFI